MSYFFHQHTFILCKICTFTLFTWELLLSETGILSVGVNGRIVALIVSVKTVTHSPKHGRSAIQLPRLFQIGPAISPVCIVNHVRRRGCGQTRVVNAHDSGHKYEGIGDLGHSKIAGNSCVRPVLLFFHQILVDEIGE